MVEVFQLKDFEPKQSHHIFLDANVLIYAFAPIANYKHNIQRQISNFFEVSMKVNANLYVTSLVLSEIYNLLLKENFDDWKRKPENIGKNNLKKDFRPTEEFKEGVIVINSIIKNILKLASPFPDDFHLVKIERINQMCNNADFNDCYFLEIASRKNWMIFTRDRDIIDHPMRVIPVITNLD